MRYIAAFLLLQLGGNAAPTAENIKTVLSSVGVDADEERLTTLLKELEGKDVNALIAEGLPKLASVGSAAGASASSGSAPAAGGASEAPKAAEKVEEKEESDEDMGFGLFD